MERNQIIRQRYSNNSTFSYRGKNKGLYLILIDTDKQEATHELATRNGNIVILEKLATRFIVEQHKSDLTETSIHRNICK